MKSKTLPVHIAFVVDGNRRWARKKGLAPIVGHRRVVKETLDPIIEHAVRLKIPYLTFWVFSTENWKRGRLFAKTLFSLLKEGIKKRAAEYTQKGYQFKTIGDLSKLPEDLQKLLKKWQRKSAKNKKITVTIAINYGGRDEIMRALKKIRNSKHEIRNLTKENFGQFLDTAGMPDPELIIRTGGEKRLSGFLLWQSEYTELYFTDILFPDFDVKQFDKALEWYAEREKRFGK